MDGEFWSWIWETYLANKEQIVPLVPLAVGVLAFVGGLLTVLVGSVVAWAALRQARIARLRHQEQTRADLQRRIIESFAKAVEQLGNKEIQVRLGGIYIPERLSRESEDDYWPIMETLTAFVRERVRWKDEKKEKEKDEDMASAETVADSSPRAKVIPSPLPTDVNAILTVIMRRKAESREREKSEDWQLNLTSTDLRGAYLRGAHLERAILAGVHLEGVVLNKACLDEAFLAGVHLQKADLVKAYLKRAILLGANLDGADLTLAHLEEADLTLAHLEGAKLISAHLEGADLSEVKGLIQAQINAAFGNTETKLPEGLAHPAHWLPKQDRDQ